MNFRDLRKKRATEGFSVTLETGEEVILYSPTVDGVRSVLAAASKAKERESEEDQAQSGSALLALMLMACSGEEELNEKEAEQAIYDCGGPASPVASKLMELIYGKDASKALNFDPTLSGDTSESVTSEA